MNEIKFIRGLRDTSTYSNNMCVVPKSAIVARETRAAKSKPGKEILVADSRIAANSTKNGEFVRMWRSIGNITNVIGKANFGRNETVYGELGDFGRRGDMRQMRGEFSVALVYKSCKISPALCEPWPIRTTSGFSNPLITSPCAINSGLYDKLVFTQLRSKWSPMLSM